MRIARTITAAANQEITRSRRIVTVIFMVCILCGSAALEFSDAGTVAVIGRVFSHLLDRPTDKYSTPIDQLASVHYVAILLSAVVDLTLEHFNICATACLGTASATSFTAA